MSFILTQFQANIVKNDASCVLQPFGSSQNHSKLYFGQVHYCEVQPPYIHDKLKVRSSSKLQCSFTLIDCSAFASWLNLNGLNYTPGLEFWNKNSFYSTKHSVIMPTFGKNTQVDEQGQQGYVCDLSAWLLRTFKAVVWEPVSYLVIYTEYPVWWILLLTPQVCSNPIVTTGL